MRIALAALGLVLVGALTSADVVFAQPPAVPAEPAAAAPAPAPGTGPGSGGSTFANDPAAFRPAVPPDAPAAPAATQLTIEQILERLKNDRELSDELLRQLKARHALELNQLTQKRHDDDSKQIALNKKHVVLAYAALWLLAIVFLVVQWRRQQALDQRITQLQKELEAATREGAR